MSVSAWIDQVFELAGRLCHGRAEALFCFRCAGVWAGLALALPLALVANRRVPLWLWALLAAAILQMPVLGFGEVPLPEEVKALSGQLFGASALFLLLLATVRPLAKPSSKSAAPGLLLLTLAAVLALQTLIRIHSAAGYRILDALCTAGLAIGALLSLWAIAALFLPQTWRRNRE